MARGGKREGAGRKKGIRNKHTLQREKEIAATGLTPLEYMLEVLRDITADKSRRDWAAAAAAPYIHSRMPVALVPTSPPGTDANKIEGNDQQILNLYLRGVHAEADSD